MQNVYKSSSKIKIRWLNETTGEKQRKAGIRVYTLDFYDVTDFDCVLTTVDLDKVDKSYELSEDEQTRIASILKKSIDVEKGVVPRPTVTEENPDGCKLFKMIKYTSLIAYWIFLFVVDLSLYKDEAQLDKFPRKRKHESKSDDEKTDEDYEEESPRKKKPAKKPAGNAKKSPKKVLKTNDSTESDEENLMEIKKKVKRQVKRLIANLNRL
jgi:hypothetical protein